MKTKAIFAQRDGACEIKGKALGTSDDGFLTLGEVAPEFRILAANVPERSLFAVKQAFNRVAGYSSVYGNVAGRERLSDVESIYYGNEADAYKTAEAVAGLCADLGVKVSIMSDGVGKPVSAARAAVCVACGKGLVPRKVAGQSVAVCVDYLAGDVSHTCQDLGKQAFVMKDASVVRARLEKLSAEFDVEVTSKALSCATMGFAEGKDLTQVSGQLQEMFGMVHDDASLLASVAEDMGGVTASVKKAIDTLSEPAMVKFNEEGDEVGSGAERGNITTFGDQPVVTSLKKVPMINNTGSIGFSLDGMIALLQDGGYEGYRIVYGSRSLLYHLVTPDDIDYHTGFTLSIEDFLAGKDFRGSTFIASKQAVVFTGDKIKFMQKVMDANHIYAERGDIGEVVGESDIYSDIEVRGTRFTVHNSGEGYEWERVAKKKVSFSINPDEIIEFLVPATKGIMAGDTGVIVNVYNGTKEFDVDVRGEEEVMLRFDQEGIMWKRLTLTTKVN